MHGLLAHGESPSESRLAHIRGCVDATNLLDLLGRQLGPSVVFAPRPTLWVKPRRVPISLRATPLPSHIRGVIRRSPEPEMIRIHARAVIAGVQDEETGRNRTSMQLPGKPVGQHDVAVALPELPVAVDPLGSGPQPAAFGFLDVLPKPYFRRCRDVDPRHEPRLTRRQIVGK